MRPRLALPGQKNKEQLVIIITANQQQNNIKLWYNMMNSECGIRNAELWYNANAE
jgi:hypothetical protein